MNPLSISDIEKKAEKQNRFDSALRPISEVCIAPEDLHRGDFFEGGIVLNGNLFSSREDDIVPKGSCYEKLIRGKAYVSDATAKRIRSRLLDYVHILENGDIVTTRGYGISATSTIKGIPPGLKIAFLNTELQVEIEKENNEKTKTANY